jgi:hypothetical protein
VGGQRHAPAALPTGKPRYPLYRRLGGLQCRSGKVRKIAPARGFDPRTVLYRPSCPGPHRDKWYFRKQEIVGRIYVQRNRQTTGGSKHGTGPLDSIKFWKIQTDSRLAPGILSLRVQRSESEADHSSPSSAEVRMNEATPLLPRYDAMG